MKKVLALLLVVALISSCGGNATKDASVKDSAKKDSVKKDTVKKDTVKAAVAAPKCSVTPCNEGPKVKSAKSVKPVVKK